jgi:hypothetical protein
MWGLSFKDVVGELVVRRFCRTTEGERTRWLEFGEDSYSRGMKSVFSAAPKFWLSWNTWTRPLFVSPT